MSDPNSGFSVQALTLVSFLVTVTKYLERQLKEGGFVLSHCSSVRHLMVGQPEMEGKLEIEGQPEMD